VRRIFWDTNLFIYLMEANPEFGPRVRDIYTEMQRRGDFLLANAVVLSEILVGPYKASDLAAAKKVEAFFSSPGIAILPYPTEAARIFAKLRASEGVKSIDALHLASAAHAGVDLFLTHDRRLNKLAIPGIRFIASLDTDLFLGVSRFVSAGLYRSSRRPRPL
jgi:predicted nucleic acid-binding protein